MELGLHIFLANLNRTNYLKKFFIKFNNLVTLIGGVVFLLFAFSSLFFTNLNLNPFESDEAKAAINANNQ